MLKNVFVKKLCLCLIVLFFLFRTIFGFKVFYSLIFLHRR